MVQSIMIQGTASGVGKTILTTALCRIFKQDGLRVAPFKSQNITANTIRLACGGEMAISQVLQAQAAGVMPTVDMNPIVMNPNDHSMELILNGVSQGSMIEKSDGDLKQKLMDEALAAYHRLAVENDVIVIEGAGSPVELNLTADGDDIVNMGLAEQVDSPVLLVSDIDRGGLFAHLYGTMQLLTKVERARVKGLIVNRFYGGKDRFAEGVHILERITERPVIGIVPHMVFELPEEDALYQESVTFTLDKHFETQFDRIADTVREVLDMKRVYDILNDSKG